MLRAEPCLRCRVNSPKWFSNYCLKCEVTRDFEVLQKLIDNPFPGFPVKRIERKYRNARLKLLEFK